MTTMTTTTAVEHGITIERIPAGTPQRLQGASSPACVCAVRGYCADVPGDPLACRVCVHLVGDEPCPMEEGGVRGEGTLLRAVCVCGWQSPALPSRPEAAAAGAVHVRAERLRCPAWCAGAYEAGHPDDIIWHHSAEQCVRIDRLARVVRAQGDDDAAATVQLVQFADPLGDDDGAITVRVAVGSATVDLDTAEAVDLATAILAAFAVAEDGAPLRSLETYVP